MKSKEKASYAPSTNTEKRTHEYAITTYELVVLFVGLASSASIALNRSRICDFDTLRKNGGIAR